MQGGSRLVAAALAAMRCRIVIKVFQLLWIYRFLAASNAGR